jgi:uncharacterized protein YceH (UPF0502 family)
MKLDRIQIRVLGALIEKEITTPETYPLSLHALLAACNQRSSRDPVMELTEEEVRQALHWLEEIELVRPVREGRVPKYEHLARTVLNLRRDETAVLCLLLLRGPLTVGEIRSRADRLYSFDDLEAVQNTLERLASRPPVEHGEAAAAGDTGPLTAMLARQPGAREPRYAHLLGGPVEAAAEDGTEGRPSRLGTPPEAQLDAGEIGGDLAARVAELEAEVARLRTAVKALEARGAGEGL